MAISTKIVDDRLVVDVKTLQEVISALREIGGGSSYQSQENDLANILQFGLEGRDGGDGHRCIFCALLCGGDQSHKCW